MLEIAYLQTVHGRFWVHPSEKRWGEKIKQVYFSLHPSEKRWGEKIQQVYLSLHFLHSLHSQTHFFYKFKMFVHSGDFIRADCDYFISTNDFSSKVELDILWGNSGNEPGCLGRIEQGRV